MRAVIPILAVLVLVLTGCTSNPTVVDGGHRLVVATGVPGAMAGVGFGGKLGVDRAGCVVLGGDSVLLAPPGSTLKGDTITIAVGGGRTSTFKIGQTTNQLGGEAVGADSKYVPAGIKCSSDKFLLLG